MSVEDFARIKASVLERVARAPADFATVPDFIDLLPLAIYACDAEGRILWFNSRAVEMWGREPRLNDDADKFCGSYKLYFGGRETPLPECPMAHALRTGQSVRGVEGKIERPDGSSTWATVYIEPIEDSDGSILGAVNCFHETTSLHHSPDAIEDFFENSALPMHLVSRAGVIVRANKAELTLLGYSADEYVGHSIVDFHADRPVIDDILCRLMRGEPIHRYRARLCAKDGSLRHVEITSNARVEDGELLNTRCVTVDATGQVEAEANLAQGAEEQAALFDFTEKLQRSTASEEIYSAALDAITRALRCERASILLFDSDDVMRFVAWRGLSDRYRRAVEGHSPWDRTTQDPQPLCLDDIHHADLGEELTRTVDEEGIGALAFIPLLDNRRLLGKFMVYYSAPHRFSDAEIDIALTIARQVGFSIGRVNASLIANRLAAIVESSDDAIISKDLNGIISTWNRGAETIFGYPAEEAIGKPMTMLISAERVDEETHILGRIRAGEKVDHFETIRRRKDGSLIDISLAVSPVRDAWGRVVGASNISRDISERKRAEAKLDESQRQLQELLSAIPAAIYTTDAEGKITYFNEAAVELAGRRPVLGSDEWCVTWKLYLPDGTPLPHDQCPMAVALKEGRPIRNAEAIAERPDGTRIPFIPYPTPLRDADGKVVGAINMLVDISERRHAETHARVLLNELNHRVKNNMQMIQSLLESAARQVHSMEARTVFAEASRRIAAMSAAQRVLYATTNATEFNAVEFLAAVCNTVQETFPNNVKVVCERASGELSNDVAMPLALILNELLTNAAKHGVRRVGDVIRVGLVEDKAGFELYVEDTGAGFDLATVRAQSSGLRLVEGLARQLRGHFEVTKNPSRCSLKFA